MVIERFHERISEDLLHETKKAEVDQGFIKSESENNKQNQQEQA